MRVHEVERVFGMQLPHQREDRTRDKARVEPAADLGKQAEDGAVDRKAELAPVLRGAGKRAIAPEGDRRQADRVDQRHIPMRFLLQRFERLGDEYAEARMRGIGKQRR